MHSLVYSISMATFMLIIFILTVLALIFLNAIKLQSSEEARKLSRRYDILMPYAMSLQIVLVAFFLAVSVLLAVASFGWFLGLIIAVVLSLEYSVISKLSIVQKYSHKIFTKYEKNIFGIINKIRPYLKLIKSISNNDLIKNKEIFNRDDLKTILESSSFLTKEEKSLFINGLEFNQKTVGEVMTPRSLIKSIEKSEFLGPLVLDDLHKQGHSRLPVINKDIDHVVGVLYLHDLLSLEQKKSTTAEKIMEGKVYYIHKDQNLDHALSAFINTKHHLFIVINDIRETVGLLTLRDALETLIGRKLEDRFSHHDNIELVSKRILKENNNPPNHQDV